jgi:hypothetical protein
MALNLIIELLALLGLVIILFYIVHKLTLKYSKEKFKKLKTIPLCPRCGSNNMQMADLFLGPFGPAKHRCADCGYEGQFMEVDKNKVSEFRKTLKKKS